MSSGIQRRSLHIVELDGVRGIAVLMVMIYHFGAFYAMSHRGILVSALSLGWCGVDLFFVLSGFLITGILLQTRRDAHFFRNFYIRRGLRILPLYYIYLLAFAFLFLPVAHSLGKFRGEHIGQLALYWVHLSNWSSAWGTLANSPVGQMWSLAIEEQFYFFWPFLVFLVPEEVLPYLCLTFVAAAIGLRHVPAMRAIQLQHPNFFYRLTPFRIEPICYGAVIALFYRKRDSVNLRKRLGYLCLIGGVILLGYQWRQGYTFDSLAFNMATLGYTAVGLCASGAILLALAHEGSNSLYARILRSPMLRGMGKYSYAMYLFHVPIAGYSDRLARHFLGSTFLGFVANCIFGIGVSYGIAMLSWKYLEAPILSLKDRIAGYGKEAHFEYTVKS
jgi:peptidoglycan/LPS O-acetylase OafA/YrhL